MPSCESPKLLTVSVMTPFLWTICCTNMLDLA